VLKLLQRGCRGEPRPPAGGDLDRLPVAGVRRSRGRALAHAEPAEAVERDMTPRDKFAGDRAERGFDDARNLSAMPVSTNPLCEFVPGHSMLGTCAHTPGTLARTSDTTVGGSDGADAWSPGVCYVCATSVHV
jgi:hypothetical protein